jgi:dolichol-phosphate mannosyltransferase
MERFNRKDVKRMQDKLYIVIPAYNEETNIEGVAKEWHDVVEKIGPDSRLVIINDGSKDHTYEELCRLKDDLPQLIPITKVNEGHGATVLYGYNYALTNKADYIFQTDSDGQTLPSEFDTFWEERGKYSAIIGYRSHRQDGFSRILVTKTLKLVLWIIFGLNITDANTPYRLFSHDVLSKYIFRIPEKFNLSNVMLTVLLLNGKEKVKFIPITFRPRQGGVNSINFRKITKIGWQAVKDFYNIKKEMKVKGDR